MFDGIKSNAVEMEKYDVAFSVDNESLDWSSDSNRVALESVAVSRLGAFEAACTERFPLLRLVLSFSVVLCNVIVHGPAVDVISPYTLGREADDITGEVSAMELPTSAL